MKKDEVAPQALDQLSCGVDKSGMFCKYSNSCVFISNTDWSQSKPKKNEQWAKGYQHICLSVTDIRSLL